MKPSPSTLSATALVLLLLSSPAESEGRDMPTSSLVFSTATSTVQSPVPLLQTMFSSTGCPCSTLQELGLHSGMKWVGQQTYINQVQMCHYQECGSYFLPKTCQLDYFILTEKSVQPFIIPSHTNAIRFSAIIGSIECAPEVKFINIVTSTHCLVSNLAHRQTTYGGDCNLFWNVCLVQIITSVLRAQQQVQQQVDMHDKADAGGWLL